MSMFKRVEGSWSDGLQSGSRRPRLFVISPAGEVTKFTGASIPGVLAVVGERFRKNGKWSETTYQLRTAPGAAMVECLEGLHQQPFDAYESWAAAVADAERVAQHPIASASLRAAVEADYPKSMGRLDAREAALAALAPAPAPEPEPEPEPAPAPEPVIEPGFTPAADDADEATWVDVILSEVTPAMLHTESGPAGVRYVAIDADRARRIVRVGHLRSAVADAATAARFTTELGVLIPANPVRATLQSGVVALVGYAESEDDLRWYLAEVL